MKETQFFKENLIHLLLINNTLNNQLSIYDNDLQLKYINFNGLNIEIKTYLQGAVYENIEGIVVQKSKIYENQFYMRKNFFTKYHFVTLNTENNIVYILSML